MKNKKLNYKNFLTGVGFLSLLLISYDNEIRANYSLENNKILRKNLFDGAIKFKRNNLNEGYFQKFENIFLVNNSEKDRKNVLISEIIIEGWEGHPEGRKLELAAYDSMSIKPGSIVNNQILKKDLEAIYASGWFSGVKFRADDGPLGVKLIVEIVPNPILKKVTINPNFSLIPEKFVNNIFKKYYGNTLNLNELQQGINLIKGWYEEKGYSLARVNSPERISDDGNVILKVDEGIVSDIKIRFIGADEKIRKGKTKDWVIKRELKTASGVIFNRKILESDIKRLYATALFDDVKVSLSPDEEDSKKVLITLDISEQRTGSLTGGVGFSNAAGIFAQLGFKESNALGRAWTTNLNLNFGTYSTTYNISLFDPWIKGDKYKTAFRSNIFLSRDYPQEFTSEDNGRLYAVNDTTSTSSDSLSSVVLENVGGGFTFLRPLNDGDPFKETPWRVSLGMNFKKVTMMDSDGNKKPYSTKKPTSANISEIICIGYTKEDGSCPAENTLISVVAGGVRNKLNNNINPTSGNILRFGSEQFLPLGDNSPVFNRLRASYAWFTPLRLINLTKECKGGDFKDNDCPQTIGFQIKSGMIIGDLPPYESFCMGGASSVRGWGSCELSVSKSFAEVSAEYRFPIWRMISGAFFADAGSDLGSQSDVPGKPGKLLDKTGSGYSLGGGLGIKTPVGPLRLDIATQDLSGNMRYTLGVGWKF
tara:strand:- start:6158 stop:8275 length:2118 start_codon:yes stop_codon:yes gene_type:complete